MCFTIPLKILKIHKNTASLEGGLTVKIEKDLKIKIGDYARIAGNILIDVLTEEEGLRVRKLIKKIY